jgi:hypothetical protein
MEGDGKRASRTKIDIDYVLGWQFQPKRLSGLSNKENSLDQPHRNKLTCSKGAYTFLLQREEHDDGEKNARDR